MSHGALITLQPARVDLALYAGDGALVKIFLDNVIGDVIVISGLVTAQIRASRSATSALQDFSVDLSGASSGIVELALTGAQTASLAATEDFVGVWDVQHNPSGEEARSLVQGKVTVKQDVTRP